MYAFAPGKNQITVSGNVRRQKRNEGQSGGFGFVDHRPKPTGLSGQSGHIIQRVKESKGIKYAVDDADAVSWLKANVSNWDQLKQEEKDAAVNTAKDKKMGVMTAKRYADSTDFDRETEARKRERARAIDDDFREYTGSFGNELAEDIFTEMRNAYIGGVENISIAGEYTQREVNDAIRSFRVYLEEDGRLTPNITNVHFFNRQDKAAAGKGNVGDTLARRGIQANFIAKWRGRIVNVHVDLA